LVLCNNIKKDGWKSRWVLSDWKRNEGKAGTFKYTAGKWPADPDDKGTYPLTQMHYIYYYLYID